MTNETSDLPSESNETTLHHRRKKCKSEDLSLPQSEKLTTRQSIIQWFASFFTRDSSDKIDIKLNTDTKKKSSRCSCLCRHFFLKLFLFCFAIYLIMFFRPDYSVVVRNSFENLLKKFNLTSEEFRLRPGQRLSQYRQPSMPIIIIPGIISTGLELWRGTECTAGKFRYRFWTSMQMLDTIGRDHQCWLKHVSLNLSTW